MQHRREFLTTTAAALCGSAWGSLKTAALADGAEKNPKRVAAIVTIYTHNSHTDVLVGKVLDGWKQDGGPGPNLVISSMYVDQFPAGDLARKQAEKHGFPITKTIHEALTSGSRGLSVDGVLLIGEHGNYPWNDKQQHLYPRRRFLREIASTFEKADEVVPVFHDKHFGPQWDDAKWMYDRAQELQIPLMAGSSLPVSFRSPDLTIPWGSQIEKCLAIGYSGLDIYGFHTLEFLQCLLERRQHAEAGVESVQAVKGDQLQTLIDDGIIDRHVLQTTLKVTPNSNVPLEETDPSGFTVFLIRYRDGLLAPVLMLSGYARGISVGWQLKGEPEAQACLTEERSEPRYPHFAYLLKGVEQMFHRGQPTYPAERTLLTAGTLDRLLTSRHEGYLARDTPELAIAYAPVDYGYAPHIDLDA